jgi:PKD repeat protein
MIFFIKRRRGKMILKYREKMIIISIITVVFLFFCTNTSLAYWGWEIVADAGIRNDISSNEMDNRYLWGADTITINDEEYLYLGTSSDEDTTKIQGRQLFWYGFGGEPNIYKTSEKDPGLDDWGSAFTSASDELLMQKWCRGFRKIEAIDGDLYIGTHVDPSHMSSNIFNTIPKLFDRGCKLWKYNTSGDEWSCIGDNGFADVINLAIPACSVRAITEYNGKIYVGLSHLGSGRGTIVRNKVTNPSSNDDWENILSERIPAVRPYGGFDKTVSGVSWIKEFEGRLYAGCTGKKSLARIYRTVEDDIHPDSFDDWQLVFQSKDLILKRDWSILSMEEFDGYLYVGTCNLSGASIFRSDTGAIGTWNRVLKINPGGINPQGPLYPRNVYVWNMRAYDGWLYAGTMNCTWNQNYPFSNNVPWTSNYAGFELWKTDTGDEGDWETAAPNGFNDKDNFGVRNMIEYEGDFYVGTAKTYRNAAARSDNMNNKGCELWKKVGIPSNGLPVSGDIDLDGPTEAKIGKEYEYTVSAPDPDGDYVCYQIDWDMKDENSERKKTGYSIYVTSDAEVTFKHTWLIGERGDHSITARVRDAHGDVSAWSSPITTSVKFTALYEYSPSPAVKGETITFTSQASAGTTPYNYTWYFPQQRGTQQKYTPIANHSFDSNDSYVVNLSIRDDDDNYSNVSKTIQTVNIRSAFNTSTLMIQPNATIYFNDTSVVASEYHIDSWEWDLGDGNSSSQQNISHNYTSDGIYNVTLTVTDNESHNASKIVYIVVDSVAPLIDGIFSTSSLSLNYRTAYENSTLYNISYGTNLTLSAYINESASDIDFVKINITSPDQTTSTYTMVPTNFDYYIYNFTNTTTIGEYTYSIWTKDAAGNNNESINKSFNVRHAVGNMNPGPFFLKDVWHNMTGSNFTSLSDGTATNITAFLATTNDTISVRCMLFRRNDSTLVEATEEKNISTNWSEEWITFNFSGSGPKIDKNQEYLIMCWSNGSCVIGCDYLNYTDSIMKGFYNDTNYTTPPTSMDFLIENTTFDYGNHSYSMYCNYNTPPEILSVSHNPTTVGFGNNITIIANITDNESDIDVVNITITYPNNSTGTFAMDNLTSAIYQYIFNDTWMTGNYTYLIYVNDSVNNTVVSNEYSYYVAGNATINVCVIKNNYAGNETIDLTDPPTQPITIGHELLDNNQILHIWNRYDHYYFDTNSGIQLTNHKDDYWTKNVLMLGYYNNDQWNLIYRTDELTGFTKQIETDNQTYVNATLWKDLSYNGYEFRLAIRYHLGMNDTELTVIPYIKNLGSSIPYQLGFGWELKDIQIDTTPENDYFEIDDTSYYLNSTLDNNYTDLDETRFDIKEDITPNKSESLYMIWYDTLNYKLTVKSRENQSNAPVTLFIKIGTLTSGQEKYTELLWHDAAEITYYFDSYGGEGDPPEAWTTNPGYMVDSNITTYATTGTPEDVELCDRNTCPGDNLGTISKVLLRVYGKYAGAQYDIILRPVYGGTTDGADRYLQMSTTGGWSDWVDITAEGNATFERNWNWNDIQNLDCDIESEDGYFEFTLYCSKVELKVEFTGDTSTEVYHYIENQEGDWEYPEYMVDGDEETFAYAQSDGLEQLCLTSSCEGEDLGTIYQVELRACGMREGSPSEIFITPVFNGTVYGESFVFQLPEGEPGWSDWYNITNDPDAPGVWNWSDITALDCHVESNGTGEIMVSCSKIEVRVSYVEPPNSAPGVGNPSPADNEMGVSLIPTVSVVVSDVDGDTLNLTWLSNSSGSWQVFGTNNSVNPGTYYQTFSNTTVNGQWWYWRVNVSDGENYTLGPIYKFYTGYQSKITNTGNTNFKGYLLIQVQYYNTTSGNWTVVDDTVNETNPRSLLADGPVGSDVIGLDTLFNGLVNTNNFSSYGNGTYRIYATFRTPDGDLLELPGGAKIEATYEFTITFS